jgi:hypothetical protein
MSKKVEPFPICFEPRHETHRLVNVHSTISYALPPVLDDPSYYLSKTERLFYVVVEGKQWIIPLDQCTLQFEKREKGLNE